MVLGSEFTVGRLTAPEMLDCQRAAHDQPHFAVVENQPFDAPRR